MICISASHRAGNTERVLERIAQMSGAEIVRLRRAHIELCNGCLECEKGRECPLDDDVKSIAEEIGKNDVIIFGTPVYFDNVSPLLLNLICRLLPIIESAKGKRIGLVICGELKGDEGTVSRRVVIGWFKKVAEYFGWRLLAVLEGEGTDPNDWQPTDAEIRDFLKRLE